MKGIRTHSALGSGDRHKPQRPLAITRRETDSLRDWDARTRFGAGMRLLRNGLFAFVVDASRDCAEALEDWPADVVVFDWMLTGAAIAAEGADLPALVHCPYPLPVPGVPPLFSGLSPVHGPLGRGRDADAQARSDGAVAIAGELERLAAGRLRATARARRSW